jgi:hypothetical protein
MADSPRAPSTFLTIATVIGGHLMNGKRSKAYTYLLILLIWPFVVFIGQALIGLKISEQVSNTGVGLAAVLGLAVIWCTSVAHALRDRRIAIAQPEVRHVHVRAWEIAALTISTYVWALYTVFSFLVAPHLPRDRPVQLLHWTSKANVNTSDSVSRILTSGEGDLVLGGVVVEQGDRARANAQLLLMFHEGTRSPEIKANANGEFEFRLPPGDWRFAGPLIRGAESRPVSVTFKPEIVKPEFHVAAGPPTRKVYLRIVIE